MIHKNEIHKDDILNYFLYPIEYDDNKILISNDIKNDLEIQTNNCPYKIIFKTSNQLGDIMTKKWGEYYSNNKKYIKHMRDFITSYKKITLSNEELFFNNYIEFKNERNFLKKYDFISWKHLDFINNSSNLLQLMTYYNITSPLINLCLPLILFIMPFFMLSFFTNMNISFYSYKILLQKQLKNHSLGKLFNIFSPNISNQEKVSASLGVAFYFFSIYQSILAGIGFYKNINNINQFLYDYKSFIIKSIDNIHLLERNSKYIKKFNKHLVENKNKLKNYLCYFDKINNSKFSLSSIINNGENMKLFNELFHNEEMHKTIMFSFGLTGFIDNLNKLKERINNKKMNKVKLSNKNKLINQYYIYVNKPVKNSIDLDNNYILTGPNASGKTTLLKTTILNLFFSQQFGYGCYEKCYLNPYDFIYSYINIPDTSERESLFELEAKRCLFIINEIERLKTQRNFIIFDELYSGTNNYEAIISANSYLKYLINKKINFILTTHFKELTKIENIENYKMDCNIDNSNNIIYKYKFIKGVNNINGGLKVLENMDYPREIIMSIKNKI